MRIAKVLGIVVGAALVLAILSIGALYVVSGHRMRRHYEVRAEVGAIWQFLRTLPAQPARTE
jgi:hypothetical protein